MRCSKCHTEYKAEDVYCHQCGNDLVETSTSIVPLKTNLPALLYNPRLPRRVAASVGAVALGVGIELLRRNMLARLSPVRVSKRSLPALNMIKDTLFPGKNKIMKMPKGYEVHETVVYMQRVIRRED